MPLQNVQSTNNLLARILIAKIEDEDRLIALIRRSQLVQGDPHWRCRSWVAQVLQEMSRDGKVVGTAELDWVKIEARVRAYVAQKTADGRYQNVADLQKPRPTWDMLEDREIIP